MSKFFIILFVLLRSTSLFSAVGGEAKGQVTIAVEKHNFIAVKKLLKEGSVSSEDVTKAAQLARKTGQLDLAHLLEYHKEGDAFLQKNLNEGLVEACDEGDLAKAEYLIQEGAKVDCVSSKEGLMPVTYAIKKRNFRLMNLLERYGANTHTSNISPNENDRAFLKAYNKMNDRLVEACSTNDFELIEWLVRRGANVNAVNRAGITPLMAATIHKHVRIVLWLIAHGADVNVSTREGSALSIRTTSNIHHILVKQAYLNQQLLEGCKAGNLEQAKSLVEQGGNIYTKDAEGYMALDYLLSSEDQRAIEAIKDILHRQRRYFKEALGAAAHPRDPSRFYESKQQALARIHEKDEVLAVHLKPYQSSSEFTGATYWAHRHSVLGNGTKILILEDKEGEWVHPDFIGLINRTMKEGEQMSPHAINVTSVAYETAPAVACAIADETQIFQCFRESVTKNTYPLCNQIKDNTIVNASFGTNLARKTKENLELLENLLKGNNMLVMASGNKNTNLSDPQHNSQDPLILRKLFSDENQKKKIIIVGGVDSSYDDAKYVKPGPDPLFQERFLSTLAIHVPVRTTGGYGATSGTSVAAPAVSGAAALILSQYPHFTMEEIVTILLASAERNFIIKIPGKRSIYVHERGATPGVNHTHNMEVRLFDPAIYGQGILSIRRALEFAKINNGHRHASSTDLKRRYGQETLV